MQVYYDKTGAYLTSLESLPTKTIFTIPEKQTLFELIVREQKDKKSINHKLTSLKGWDKVAVSFFNHNYKFRFTGLANIAGGEDLSVSIQIQENSEYDNENWYESSAITIVWDECTIPTGFSLESATLLPLRFKHFSTKIKAFYPFSSGIVCDPFEENKKVNMRYPSGFGASMPWFALWDEKDGGIYIAAHDATATTKDLTFSSDIEKGELHIAFKYPAEDLGLKNSKFAPSKIVLAGFQGDWYDAAVMYRIWMRNEANWYPRKQLTSDGRKDTPQWMKEMCVWAMGNDNNIEEFQATFGIPVGFHWYNWHEIPFDNDYPHYFPPKPHFASRVIELQKNGNIFVMPYINGRLWDSHDKATVDSLFTKKALKGVTKKEDGSPCLETYGSKEENGENVSLGVMCPSTDIWSDKLHEIILRLTSSNTEDIQGIENYGTKAVYIDQVAAAPPQECFDGSHGHPLGGSDWWTSSYRKLFKRIRNELPKNTVLTTESNADGYIDSFDGFLVWQFQHNGQVPAFATVYGGTIQLFGRDYPENETDIGTKMKLAESFVFGEQIGWLPTSILKKHEKLTYMKKIVALRYKFREYFYRGEMARRPHLHGNMPRLTATWRFTGNPSVVSVDAVSCGAWRIPEDNKAILMFASCYHESLDLQLTVNLEELGFNSSNIKITRHNPDGSSIELNELASDIHFNPEEIFIIEIHEQK